MASSIDIRCLFRGGPSAYRHRAWRFKSFAMTGWRVGWTCSSPEVASKLNYFNSQTLTCIPDFVQKAAQVALESESQFVIDLKNAIHKNFKWPTKLWQMKITACLRFEGPFICG